MSPNLYDLLDVDETATPEEIRAAWRGAIADLEPTDRRFRAYNDAAAVLLDPEKRAAYDAELAAAREADEVDVEEPDAEEAEHAEEADAEPVAGGAASAEAEPDAPSDDRPVAVRNPPATGTLVALGGIAFLSLVLMIWLFTLPGARGALPWVDGPASPQERREQAADLADTAASAEDAAGEVIRPVLSYDYRTLDEDLAEAVAHMTDGYAEQHRGLFEEVRKEATRQRIVVSASVAGTAVAQVAEDGDLAKVVVFVDQDVRKAGAEPVVLRMWATATLVREDGEWLLDDLCTEGDCG